MSQQLGPQDQATLSSLSRHHIELTMAGLKPFLSRSMWIGTTNRYARQVVDRLGQTGPSTSTHKRNLSQYIASSTCLHAADGWGYLGRAVSCLLAGDTHRALHLAYYAELRAAMSLLASVGVGIFSKKHFVVPAANTVSALRNTSGTHLIAWLTLQHWSSQQGSGTLFTSIIRPEGQPLSDWFSPRGGTAALAPLAKSWFLQWGMDLEQISKDREARNESSYRPDGIPTIWEVSPADAIMFVRDIWDLLEPSPTSAFANIDRHILRLAIEGHHQGISNRSASSNEATFVNLVNQLVSASDVPNATSRRLTDFLLRREIPEDPLIIQFATKIPSSSNSDAYAVISRAILLLRVATGSTHEILRNVGFDANHLEFWWNMLGETRGLWTPESKPASLGDLWADVRAALDDVDTVETSKPNAFSSMSRMITNLGDNTNLLSSHERVGLWGLCPA